MKRRTAFTYLCTILAVVLFVVSCGKKAEHAAEYNDSIVRKQLEIIRALDLMDSTLRDTLAQKDRIDYAFTNLRARVKQGLLALDSIGSFEKDPSLSVSARELFRVYEELSENEYHQLVQIHQLPRTSITQEIADSNNVIVLRVRDRSKAAQDKFLRSQDEFGKKYNLVFE